MLNLPRIPRIQPYRSTANGLIGCWPFFEGIGQTLHDVSGYGRDGTFVGAPVWQELPPTGPQYYGLATNPGYVSLPGMSAVILTDLPGYTVTSWVFPTLASDGNWREILVKGDRSSDQQISLLIAGAGGPGQPEGGVCFFTNQAGTGAVCTTAAVPIGVWYFCAAVHYGDGDAANLLAVFPAGASQPLAVSYFAGGSGAIDADAGINSVSLGFYSGSLSGFNGVLGEHRLYGRALASSEVWDIYTGNG